MIALRFVVCCFCIWTISVASPVSKVAVGYEAIARKDLTLYDASFANRTEYVAGSRVIVASKGSGTHMTISSSNAIQGVAASDVVILRSFTFDELEEQVQAFASVDWYKTDNPYMEGPSLEAMALQNLYVRRVRQQSPGNLPPASSTSTFDSTSPPKIEVANETDYKLYVYFSGPDVKSVSIEPRRKTTFTLQAGAYSVVAKSAKPKVKAFYGSDTVKLGYIHTHRFFIVTRKV